MQIKVKHSVVFSLLIGFMVNVYSEPVMFNDGMDYMLENNDDSDQSSTEKKEQRKYNDGMDYMLQDADVSAYTTKKHSGVLDTAVNNTPYVHDYPSAVKAEGSHVYNDGMDYMLENANDSVQSSAATKEQRKYNDGMDYMLEEADVAAYTTKNYSGITDAPVNNTLYVHDYAPAAVSYHASVPNITNVYHKNTVFVQDAQPVVSTVVKEPSVTQNNYHLHVNKSQPREVVNMYHGAYTPSRPMINKTVVLVSLEEQLATDIVTDIIDKMQVYGDSFNINKVIKSINKKIYYKGLHDMVVWSMVADKFNSRVGLKKYALDTLPAPENVVLGHKIFAACTTIPLCFVSILFSVQERTPLFMLPAAFFCPLILASIPSMRSAKIRYETAKALYNREYNQYMMVYEGIREYIRSIV